MPPSPIYVVCISSHIGTVEWQIMFVVNFDKRLDQKGWPAAPPPPPLFGTKYQFLRKHFGGRGPFNRANHHLPHDP